MKQTVLNLCICLTMLLGINAYGQSTTQTVKITNISNKKGDLYIGWYKDDATFRVNDEAVFKQKIAVNNQNEVIAEFNNIPNGKYAIAVFLDENNNYKLDKNLFGIPKEKYGFSNNILPKLRPASFEESAFNILGKDKIITITLK